MWQFNNSSRKSTCYLYFSLLKLIQQFLLVYCLKLCKLLDNLLINGTFVENFLGLVRHDTVGLVMARFDSITYLKIK